MKTYYIFGCLIIALALFLFLNFRPEFSKDKDDTYNVSVDKDGGILITPTQDMLNRFDQLKTQLRNDMDGKITAFSATLGERYQEKGDYLENGVVTSIQSDLRHTTGEYLVNGRAHPRLNGFPHALLDPKKGYPGHIGDHSWKLVRETRTGN